MNYGGAPLVPCPLRAMSVCVCECVFFLPVQQLGNSVSHATAGSDRALEAGFGMAAVQQWGPRGRRWEEGVRGASGAQRKRRNGVEVWRP